MKTKTTTSDKVDALLIGAILTIIVGLTIINVLREFNLTTI